MKKNVKRKNGFTLIEIIIVISIIAVLAAIAVPKYSSIQKDAKVKADIASAKTISDAVTALVAQEKIAETISTSVKIDNAAADSDAGRIAKYLQSIPTSRVYSGNKFWVAVDKGVATISVSNTTTDTVSTTQVYPIGADLYGPPPTPSTTTTP